MWGYLIQAAGVVVWLSLVFTREDRPRICDVVRILGRLRPEKNEGMHICHIASDGLDTARRLEITLDPINLDWTRLYFLAKTAIANSGQPPHRALPIGQSPLYCFGHVTQLNHRRL